ncbi:MAG TPA: hypothetical protein VNN22_10010 [Verrucomicrobiae bacterium]|nr:hypothetical protein [Verrucomicrobiae bacterium]
MIQLWYAATAVVAIVEGITFFGAYFGNTISWAGRRYTLLRDGTLELIQPDKN